MTDDDFIRKYEPFVRGVVERTRAQLLLECDTDDLMAFGFEGLLVARQRFDGARGVQFQSFAYYRVRGAVLDGVRAMAYLPRRAYARLKAAEAADALGESESEARAQSDAKVSGEVALRAIDGVLGRVAAAYSAASARESDDANTAGENPERDLLVKERRDLTRQAIAGLPEQERILVEGHYIEGRRFDEIAAELGLSKSWASRLHTRALGRLRELLAEAKST